jgi:uncharacterized membrane protein YfcA
MFHELISVMLGFFSGAYGTFFGTSGGAAVLIFGLIALNIIPTPTTLTGTMLFVSSIPLGVVGLYEYHKNKRVDYYIGAFIILGIMMGAFLGSKYSFIVNKQMGEDFGNKLKHSVTGVIYLLLSFYYFYTGFHV